MPQAWYPLGHGDKALLQEPLFAQLGKKYGKSAPQVILRWHIQSGNIVIPGSKNPDHIKFNFDLFDFSLTEDEMAQVVALNQNVRYYTSTPEMLKNMRKWFRRWTSRSETLSFACSGACADTGSRGVWSRYSSAGPSRRQRLHRVPNRRKIRWKVQRRRSHRSRFRPACLQSRFSPARTATSITAIICQTATTAAASSDDGRYAGL